MAKKKEVITKTDLTQSGFGARVPNLQRIVVKRMKFLGVTPYAVAKRARELGGKVTEQTVRNFIAGKTKMNSEHLGYVLASIGLELRPKGE